MAWLARDNRGRVAIFAPARRDDDLDALRAEARVLGALCARDGSEWLAAPEDDGREDERVVLVLVPTTVEGDYRSAAKLRPVDEVVSDVSWGVAREESPRVLVSSRPLTRDERETLRARADCVALLGERRARLETRARTDAIFVYEWRRNAYVRVGGPPKRPLRAEEVFGHAARFPLEFAAAPALVVADEFDGESDAAWTETDDRPLDFGEIVVNFVRNCFYVSMLSLWAAYELLHSLAFAVTIALLLPASLTAYQARPRSTVRLGPSAAARTRVALDQAGRIADAPRSAVEEEEVRETSRRAARRSSGG